MRFLLSTLLFLALGACSSGPNITPEERPTKLTLKDYRTGSDFFLLNEAHTSSVDFYSEVRGNASAKVVPNLDMGALMMALDDSGYFEIADAGFRRTPGARTTLMLELGGEKYSLSMTLDEPSRIEKVQKCNEAFLALYNAHFSMQFIDNPAGKGLLEQQQRDLVNSRKGRAFQ